VLTRMTVRTAAAGTAILALTGPAPAAQAQPAARAQAAAQSQPAAQARPASSTHQAAAFPRTAAATLLADLRQAWRTTKGKGLTVAVIGGSVDRNAVGLAGKVVTGPVYGHPGRAQANEGTLFASIVAGSGPSRQNPYRTIGLAPQARILSLSVQSNLKTSAWDADVGKAIQYAVGHGAKVVYVEQTSYTDAKPLAAAVADAVSKDVVVASAEYGPAKFRGTPEYPASLPGVIDAASVVLPRWPAPPRRLPTPANGTILVSAPGNILYASGPAATNFPVYNFFAADAWLAATAALIKSAYPGLSPAMVARALALSARDHPAGGYSPATGFGLINPAGALTQAGKLTGLRTAVAPGPTVVGPTMVGPTVVAPSARLASGPAPGAIAAVHHSAWKLAGYAVLMLAGLIMMLRARQLRKRWRRRARMPTAQSHRIGRGRAQPPQPTPEPAPPVVGTGGPG